MKKERKGKDVRLVSVIHFSNSSLFIQITLLGKKAMKIEKEKGILPLS